MNANVSKPNSHEGLLPAIFLSILSAVLALPSLWDAWRNDLYSTGGLTAFIIWLTSLGFISWFQRKTATPHSVTWVALSGLLCMAGSITSLNICHHLAFVAAICGLTIRTPLACVAALGGLTWLPACGWLVSRISSGGLAGWERPTFAAITILVLIVSLKRKPTRTSP